MGCGEEGCKDPIFQYGGYKASSSYMGRVARRTPEGLLSYTVARTSRRKVPAAITPVTVEPDKILYETLASFDGKLFRVARCVLLDATKASYLIAHECEGDVSQGEIELDLVNNKVEIAKGNPHFPVGDSFDFIVEHRVGPAPFELERENQPEQNGEPTPADKENGNG